MKPRSIRFHLTIWYALAIGVILLIVSGVVYLYVTQSLSGELDASLEGDAQELLTRIRVTKGKIERDNLLELDSKEFLNGDQEDTESEEAGNPAAQTRLRHRYEQVVDTDGSIIFKTAILGKHILPHDRTLLQQALKEHRYFTHVTIGELPLRLVTFPIIRANTLVGWGQVAISERYVKSAFRQLLLILVTCIPLGSGLACIVGWLLARKALQPIDRITQTAQRIEAENLSERMPPREVDDEVGRLINTLNELFSRLEASFKQIQQFTADASHELRTPLTAMRGEIEVALRSERSPERYRQILASLLEEIDRMANIVEGLLTLSRADSGELSLRIEPVRLDDLMRETYEYGRMLASEKDIDVFLTTMPPVTVDGDALRLREALLNLLDNAVKYTPEGGQVSLSLTEANGSALASVQDTGVGIPSDDIPRIFHRFYRGDKSHSHQVGGCGLGLSIVKWIVDAHHGRIEVVSEVDHGSRFTIVLPKSRKRSNEETNGHNGQS